MDPLTDYFQAAMVADGPGLPMALFLAGLIGGGVHCLGMCGPFVLAQVGARLDRIPAAEMGEFHRLTGGALLPYHLGRGTTYTLLGLLAGSLAGGMSDLAQWRWLSGLLLVLAAGLFLLQAVGRLGGRGLGFPVPRLPGRWMAVLIDRPLGWRGYLLGVLLGFLPCGLIYGALAAAAASGDALWGALAMGAFFIGTVPALLGLGLAGGLAAGQWREMAVRFAGLLMGLNGLLLLYLAYGQIVGQGS